MLKRLAGFFVVFLPALGWALTTAARGVDDRYVKQSTYDADKAHAHERDLVDSVSRASLIQKVDSANVRLQQLVCGQRIQQGCR